MMFAFYIIFTVLFPQDEHRTRTESADLVSVLLYAAYVAPNKDSIIKTIASK